MSSIRNFEPSAVWANADGTLTERAKGYLRALWDYIGATAGAVPTGSLGGDGVTTNTYLTEAGTWVALAYPTGADPTAQAGTAVINGSAATFMRSDAAPAINLGITPTWTGAHIFNAGVTTTTLAMTGALTGATSIATTGGISTGSTTLHTTTAALTNGAAAAAGTLLNAPVAGNPTKWVPINDNGTTRYIPCW